MPSTKMVCTLGPASSSDEILRRMVREGLDLARINMSHGTHDEHRSTVERLRAAARREGRPLGILVDLSGPKIRVGDLHTPVELADGSVVTFAPEAQAEEGEIPTTFPELAAELQPGDRVLLDDGLLELKCRSTEGVRAHLEVERGGVLKSRKGINLPGVSLHLPSLTEKDLEDLDFALDIEAEYVGLSFVRRAADVADLKQRVGGGPLVVAKIEKAEALEALDEILEVTDAVMVARGDLGVELPFEQVPVAQKRIIRRANHHGRPVITATQMLESMVDYPRPTRAEASDVANAVLDGTDAVMLSGETAVGDYPVEALRALVRIAREVEESGGLEGGPRYMHQVGDGPRAGASPREHAIASSTVASARQLGSPAIIVITRSGFSARLVSSYRPPVPIFAVTTERKVYSQLSAVWGVQPSLSVEEDVDYESLTAFGRRCVLHTGVGEEGEAVVVTAGYPFHTAGSTNTMRVESL